MRLHMRTARTRERGAQLVEAIIILPLFLMLLIGMVSFASAYRVFEAITRAAREGARAIVVTSCAACGNAMYSAATVRTTYVEPSLSAANLDPTQVTGYATTYVWMDPGASPPQECGAEISFNYPYQLAVPFTSVNLTTISIPARVRMRLENQPAACSAGTAVP